MAKAKKPTAKRKAPAKPTAKAGVKKKTPKPKAKSQTATPKPNLVIGTGKRISDATTVFPIGRIPTPEQAKLIRRVSCSMQAEAAPDCTDMDYVLRAVADTFGENAREAVEAWMEYGGLVAEEFDDDTPALRKAIRAAVRANTTKNEPTVDFLERFI